MTKNEIFNYIATYLSGAYVTSNYEETPAEFPCVMVIQAAKMRPTRFMNLDYSDSQRMLTYEVQVVSAKHNTAQSEAFSYMEQVETLMNNLHFIEDMCQPIEESASKYRIVARFHANLGGGESVPNS